MSFALGNGNVTFGNYRAELIDFKKSDEINIIFLDVVYNRQSPLHIKQADNYVASKIIESLTKAGIEPYNMKREGRFNFSTHMKFVHEGKYFIEVSPYATNVYVGAVGNKEDLQKLFSGIERALSKT